MLLHMMCASVLRNGLCNSYSGIFSTPVFDNSIYYYPSYYNERSCQDVLLLLLLVTTSVTSLHTTKNEAAKDAAFALVTRWRLCVEITRTASSYGTVMFHSGTLYCHK